MFPGIRNPAYASNAEPAHKLSKRGKYYARNFFKKNIMQATIIRNQDKKAYYSYPEAQSGQKVGVQDGRASP
jgi:hypothetical protein